MKKHLSVLLVLVLLFTASTSAFADSVEISSLSVLDEGVFKPEEMSIKEKKAYYYCIDKQVKLVQEKYGNAIDADAFRKELIHVLETENSMNKIQSKSYSYMRAASGSWIPDVKIKNDVAAAAINTVIDLALLSAGVTSVAALIKKIGLKEARRLFTKTLTSKLKAWGLAALATSLPFAVNFIFNLLNPGAKIAEYLDSVDDFPNNGYIDKVL